MKLKKIYLMSIAELNDLARNINNFGSMLARNEINRRNIAEGMEPRYAFDRNDKEQYKRELYSVEWID